MKYGNNEVGLKTFLKVIDEHKSSDLKIKMKSSYNKDGTVAVKLNGLKVSKELANELGLNPKEYVKPKNKPKKVTDKNVPDIPVTPRDKGAPVKSTLTLAKLNTKIDTGLTNLDKKVDKGFSDIRTELNKKIDTGLANLDKKIDDRFDKLTSVVKTLAGIVQEQSKSLQEQSKSINNLNKSIDTINKSIDTINKSVTKLTNDRSR